MTLLYGLLVRALRFVSPVFSHGDSKLARGLAGRRDSHQLLRTWGDTLRNRDRPVAWFHAPSVGEGRSAQAVIEALREIRPDVQVVFTFFSPSAIDLAREVGADVAAYLPWDVPELMGGVVDAVRPNALVFTKTEIWPVLTAEAKRRGIPISIVGAMVPEGAGRRRWPTRAVLRPAWSALRLACADTDEDKKALVELGVQPGAIRVTGDPGTDSAASRFDSADSAASHLAPFRSDPRPTVVAGSTWPIDEAVVVPALETVRQSIRDVRLVIAPHEPDIRHVGPLIERLVAGGWRTLTLEQVEARRSVVDVDAVVVDRLGALAQLYGVASVAYVGGGFHSAGLHSVLEPAAAGAPIVFGPKHENARAAMELLHRGGAKIARNSEGLTSVITRWLRDEHERVRTGDVGRGYIERHRGAASRAAELLNEMIDRSRHTRA